MGDLNNRKDRDESIKFDVHKRPIPMRWYLVPIAWMLSFPTLFFRKHKLKRIDGDDLKPPYILLCNHNAFLDFKVAIKAIFPHTGINIVALDGFIKRESLLRKAGCICKRKFTNDPTLVRHIYYALKTLKKIVLIYPEARYSLIGTESMLPDSLGKLIKKAKVPVAMLITHGHHIDSPVWNLKSRKNPISATYQKLFDQDALSSLSVDEINQKIRAYFRYDDFLWQLENRIAIRNLKRAEGLHKILYQCPACHKEFTMTSKDSMLSCVHCGKQYQLSMYGQIEAMGGETEFSHPPDWFEWQRANVCKEVQNKTYRIEGIVNVDSLPNAKGFIDVGEGYFIHDCNGFHLTYTAHGVDRIIQKDVLSTFGAHVEYNYNNKGDCVSFSTLDDTFYLYFKSNQSQVTKIHFATEELYIHENNLLK